MLHKQVATLLYEHNGLPFHNLTHIKQVAASTAQLCILEHIPYTYELDVAVWMHDVIYVPSDSKNEIKSAELAELVTYSMGLDTEHLKGLIMLTAFHTENLSNDKIRKHSKHLDERYGKVMLDADLSGLASSPSEYAVSSANVAKENTRVCSKEQVRKGRVSWIRELLDKEYLYYTNAARGLYETNARQNLQAELLLLTQE